ncbi:hypothetical protein [Embleya sp. NPDC005971]|uniref:hypothetical protein n=1 Tax=Embleya sp. NPDC005971 TaxID=3156724 RepID=UPI0033CE6E06
MQITRKTVIAPADGLDEEPVTRPAAPDNPAYQHILTVFAARGGPLRARDVCEAPDRGVQPKHIGGMRSKPKRLVKRGILTEAGPRPFLQTRP